MIVDFEKEFICGRKSQIIADKVWDSDKRDSLSDIKDKSIIWCKRTYVEEIFAELDHHPSKSVVLISCNGDWSIDEKLFMKKSKCVKVWFSQNIDYKHPTLFPLPIGLENDKGPSKGKYTDYPYLKETVDESVNFGIKKITDKIYCNFTIKNNVIDRSRALDHLNVENLSSFSERKGYKGYCEDIRNHMFVMSPNGNGIDCHKTWETLYMGSVPIVQSHFMFDGDSHLPIIQVDSVEEINEDWIKSKVEWYNSTTFSYDELKLSHWLEKITKERSKM